MKKDPDHLSNYELALSTLGLDWLPRKVWMDSMNAIPTIDDICGVADAPRPELSEVEQRLVVALRYSARQQLELTYILNLLTLVVDNGAERTRAMMSDPEVLTRLANSALRWKEKPTEARVRKMKSTLERSAIFREEWSGGERCGHET